MTPILSVRNLSTGYGKKQVLFNVSLDVMRLALTACTTKSNSSVFVMSGSALKIPLLTGEWSFIFQRRDPTPCTPCELLGVIRMRRLVQETRPWCSECSSIAEAKGRTRRGLPQLHYAFSTADTQTE